MQIIELYINNTRVDLFKDESVSITDSIQNVRDISKIFTAFSQQFNLPASKTNNKLFKHYYNYSILNGFDARYKAEAEIKLNGINYKKGKIRLNEVTLKDNVPYSYKVVFFGDTIELKDFLNEDLLDSLDTELSDLDFEYTQANVKSKLQTGGTDVIVPLITHSRRFEIHATNNKYRSLVGNEKLSYADLKPAVKVSRIIEAIEEKYGLDFDGFFNSYQFSQLYLWLHRNEGYISNSSEGGGVNLLSNRFFDVTNPEENWTRTGGDPEQRPLQLGGNGYDYEEAECRLDVNVGGNPDEYTVIIKDGSGNLLTQVTRTGDSSNFFVAPANAGGVVDFEVIIQSENTFTITQSLNVKHVGVVEGFDDSFDYTEISETDYQAVTNSIANTFVVGLNMPKMKIFDFLVNIFKMFNLTVYKEDDKLKVETLPDFYNAGVRYDITEYVDMSKSSVSKLLQFKNILFDFSSKKTQLVKLSDEVQGTPFSQESYGNNDWDGGNYNIKVDFEKMMFERLTDSHSNPEVLTTITQGTFLDEKGEPTIGKALLLHFTKSALYTPTLPHEFHKKHA